MNLKYTYQRFISLFLLIAMLWNITGWLGMGLLNVHLLEHSEGEHCEVSFCYCKVEHGKKICSCHHPELHAAEKGKNLNHEESSSDSTVGMYCYFSKSHDSPVQSDKVIVISDFRSLLLHFKEYTRFTITSDYLTDYSETLKKGFEPSLFRPPSA